MLTPTEYDREVRQVGPRVAMGRYPYTMSYSYQGSDNEWTMFYASETERSNHAMILRDLDGVITGASGGNLTGLHGRSR